MAYLQRVYRLMCEPFDGDFDLAIIAAAVAISGIESSMRDPAFRERFSDLDTIVGIFRQRGVNALSMAESTGVPRETARRKIKQLVEMGFLVRRSHGDYVLKPGVVQASPYREMLEKLAAETVRFMNHCVENGIVDMQWVDDGGKHRAVDLLDRHL
jgi:hypothetical protein